MRAPRLPGWLIAVALAGAGVGVGAPALAAAPAPGRYDAELCVASLSAPASCGAVVVDWQRGAKVRVVLDDVRYLLQLRRRDVAVVVMHGAVQVDEFLAAYEQTDAALGFIDSARATHYELRLGARR